MSPAPRKVSPNCSRPVPKVGFATPKHYGREETHGFGLRLQVLNFASRTEKPSSKLQLSNLQSVLFPTPKPHATEGTDRPSACGCLCLTSLSEPTRNELQIAAFKPPNRWLRHSETPCHGGTHQAFGLWLPLPITSLSEPTRCQLQIAAFKPPNRWLRHTQTRSH